MKKCSAEDSQNFLIGAQWEEKRCWAQMQNTKNPTEKEKWFHCKQSQTKGRWGREAGESPSLELFWVFLSNTSADSSE